MTPLATAVILHEGGGGGVSDMAPDGEWYLDRLMACGVDLRRWGLRESRIEDDDGREAGRYEGKE